jgi:hypothetical protein
MEPNGGKREADATKGISNETVCRYFYWMFILVAVVATIAVLLDLVVVAKSPKTGLLLLLRSAPVLILSVVNAMFMYILCARTLLK